MTVGGNIIEMRRMNIVAGESPGKDTEVVRLWCMDKRTGDELGVYVEPAEVMPQIGEEIWWQGGKVMFDGDRRTLRKVGYSFRASSARDGEKG